MGFFEQIFGTELGLPARAVVALVLVLALIALTVWLMRRFGDARILTGGGGRGRQQRLAVLDSTVVDARRKLVLIRRDNVEHLILIGGPTDLVVEPNIVRAAPLSPTQRAARAASYESAEPEMESSIVPPAEPDLGEAERIPMPRPVGEPRRPAMRPPPRPDPKFDEVAHRLEEALRQPEPEPAPRVPPAVSPRLPERRPAPPPAARTPEPRSYAPPPRAPEPRTPEPRAPEPRASEPRAPEPKAPEARPAAPAAAAASTPPVAPAAAAPPAKPSAADVFENLEEEMASLLRPGGKKDQ